MCDSYIYIVLCQYSTHDCVYVWVIVDFLLLSFKFTLGCLFSQHHVIKVVSRRLPHKSLFTRPTLSKSLSGDAELEDTSRYCLVMWAKRGNSCWCFFHHMRGSVSLDTYCTSMYAFSSVSQLKEDGPSSWGLPLLHPRRELPLQSGRGRHVLRRLGQLFASTSEKAGELGLKRSGARPAPTV